MQCPDGTIDPKLLVLRQSRTTNADHDNDTSSSQGVPITNEGESSLTAPLNNAVGENHADAAYHSAPAARKTAHLDAEATRSSLVELSEHNKGQEKVSYDVVIATPSTAAGAVPHGSVASTQIIAQYAHPHQRPVIAEAQLLPPAALNDGWLWCADSGDAVQHDDYFDMMSQLASVDEFSMPSMQQCENPVSGVIVTPPRFTFPQVFNFLQQWDFDGSNQFVASGLGRLSSPEEDLELGSFSTDGASLQPARSHSPERSFGGVSLDIPDPAPRRRSESTVVTSEKLSQLPRSTAAVPSKADLHSEQHLKYRRLSDKPHVKTFMTSDLTIVQESGKEPRHVPFPGSTKGRRVGPLLETVKRNAKMCRQQKTICIRCKKDKQPCVQTIGEYCSRCIELGLTAKWQQPCTKASFLSIVESGTCNYISQRAVNHLTLDGGRRIRIDLPETLDLDDLLGMLQASKHIFDVRVRQASGSLYVLNLARCHQYLSSIRRKQACSQQNLREFIDCEILKANQWQDCVDECNPAENLMACLSVWGNMPSRASYSYVRRSNNHPSSETTEDGMDVEDLSARSAIIMAAQLSRIVCRKLEVDAYGHLQRVLNEWATLDAGEIHKFVRELGLVLLTLRWRVSWWTLLGDGGNTPDTKGKEAFAYRVHSLCRVLYFYYCMIRRKLPAWTAKKDFYGVWSTYPDTTLPVFEEFPENESLEGFNTWMLNGQELIVSAGVEGKLAGIGLRHERVASR